MSSSAAKSSILKPITIFWKNNIPDPQALPDAAQVLIILEELGLPYQSKFVNFKAPNISSKSEHEFRDASPAGILPAISDPNNDNFALFESGTIVSYLIARYDKSHALSCGSSSEAFKLQQWVYLQASRQRACLSAAARKKDKDSYDEVRKYLDTLDYHLVGEEWIYGDTCTYADLSFVFGNSRVSHILKESSEGWDPANFPHFTRWQKAMMARKSVRHVLSVMANSEVKSDGKA